MTVEEIENYRALLDRIDWWYVGLLSSQHFVAAYNETRLFFAA